MMTISAPGVMDRNKAVAALTAELMESQVRNAALFTTLDISNGLKRRLFPVRHGEVAEVVRAIYESGALGRLGYDRALIDVNTDGGATLTQAFVYLPQTAHPDQYAGRIQDALPPVADDVARDLLAGAPTRISPLLDGNGQNRRSRTGGTRSRVRLDGALPVPRRVVQEAGWNVGDTRALSVVPGTNGGAPTLVLSTPTGNDTATVRVWGDCRVRICKTALRRAGTGALPTLPLPVQSWAVQGNVIQVPLR